MTGLVCERIVTLDGFARGQRSPGDYDSFGPDVARRHAPKVYETMLATPGWLLSRMLEAADWPG